MINLYTLACKSVQCFSLSKSHTKNDTTYIYIYVYVHLLISIRLSVPSHRASMNVLRVVYAYRKRNVHVHCLSLQFYLFSTLSLSCSHLWRIVLRFSIPLPSPYHKPQPTTLLHEHARVHYQRTTSYNHIYVAPVVTHTDATRNEVAKKRLVHRNEMLFVGVRKKRAKERESERERERDRKGRNRDRERKAINAIGNL